MMEYYTEWVHQGASEATPLLVLYYHYIIIYNTVYEKVRLQCTNNIVWACLGQSAEPFWGFVLCISAAKYALYLCSTPDFLSVESKHAICIVHLSLNFFQDRLFLLSRTNLSLPLMFHSKLDINQLHFILLENMIVHARLSLLYNNCKVRILQSLYDLRYLIVVM